MEEKNARRDGVRNDWLAYPPRGPRRDDRAARLHRKEMLGDGACCRHCGSTHRLEVDHRRPLCLGGSDDRTNLQVLCRDCHKRKTGREGNVMRWRIYPREQSQ